MYYDEKVIDGVLCFRTLPRGEWRQMSTQTLTIRDQNNAARIIELEAALLEVTSDFETVCIQEGREAFQSAINARELLAKVAT